ncbi:hypothetical protein ACJJTC_019155 [Scirpophaga incertulas]
MCEDPGGTIHVHSHWRRRSVRGADCRSVGCVLCGRCGAVHAQDSTETPKRPNRAARDLPLLDPVHVALAGAVTKYQRYDVISKCSRSKRTCGLSSELTSDCRVRRARGNFKRLRRLCVFISN